MLNGPTEVARALDVSRGSDALILEDELRQHSLTLFFITIARLVEAVASLKEADRVAASPLLPAIYIALQWMATVPEHTR